MVKQVEQHTQKQGSFELMRVGSNETLQNAKSLRIFLAHQSRCKESLMSG